jgi:tetratricopeptide (TPR) repeat protein
MIENPYTGSLKRKMALTINAADNKKVFVRKVKFVLGAMGTEQLQESESYYIANFLEDGRVELNLIDYRDEPTQIKLNVSLEELKDDYFYVPDYFEKKKSPEQAKEGKHIAIGNKHLRQKEYYSAEYEYDRAIAVNPESVRGMYGKGKALLERGEVEEAFKAYENLAEIKDLYSRTYKHTFNSLGIDLRRMNKLDEAIRNYKRALSLDSDDEVLHYNIAHAYYKQNKLAEARAHLEEALKLNPNFVEGRKFLDNLIEEMQQQSGT